MVYRFKLVSDEVCNFSREIEIDSEASFFQLRNTILDSVNYSKDGFDSFFLCDEDWEREDEITLEDMGTRSDQDLWLMDTTSLEEMIDEEGQKLMFVFDYEADRYFLMEMKEMIPGRSLVEGICTMKKGNAPAQILDPDSIERVIDTKSVEKEIDLGLDFYGDADFNEDELEEGFDDLSMS